MQSSLFLPQETIINILSRLPAKCIGRCRCVSKPWRALLSEPYFLKIHLDRFRKTKLQQQQHALILLFECGSLYVLPLNLRNAHHLFDEMLTEPATNLFFAGHSHCWEKILASCDGLVLVENDKSNIFLINPVTREIRQVPPSPFTVGPGASHTMYALGYDSVNDDYKIVTLSYYNDDRGYGPYREEVFVNVYSVKNGTWKKAESSPYYHAGCHVTSGVYVNGYLHWLVYETTSCSTVIAAFDLTQEKFYEFPPPNSTGDLEYASLVEFGGCLCLCHTNFYGGTGAQVLVMEEYGNKESWTMFTIFDPEGSDFRPLCMLGQEQMVVLKDAYTSREKLVKYGLLDGSFNDIVVDGISDDFKHGGIFVESLVSPYCSHETS